MGMFGAAPFVVLLGVLFFLPFGVKYGYDMQILVKLINVFNRIHTTV